MVSSGDTLAINQPPQSPDLHSQSPRGNAGDSVQYIIILIPKDQKIPEEPEASQTLFFSCKSYKTLDIWPC
jgi:hypothetical protein